VGDGTLINWYNQDGTILAQMDAHQSHDHWRLYTDDGTGFTEKRLNIPTNSPAVMPHWENIRGMRFSAPGGELYEQRFDRPDADNDTYIRFRRETGDRAFAIKHSSFNELQIIDEVAGQDLLYANEGEGVPEFPSGTKFRQRGDPSSTELNQGECMIYNSDGSGTGSAGDLVYAYNDGGVIKTTVIIAQSDAT